MLVTLLFSLIFSAQAETARPLCSASFGSSENVEPLTRLDSVQVGVALQALVSNGVKPSLKIFSRPRPEYTKIISDAVGPVALDTLYHALFYQLRYKSVRSAVRDYGIEMPEIKSSNVKPAIVTEPKRLPKAPPSLNLSFLPQAISALYRKGIYPYGLALLYSDAETSVSENISISTRDLLIGMLTEGNGLWESIEAASLPPEIVLFKTERRSAQTLSIQEIQPKLVNLKKHIISAPLNSDILGDVTMLDLIVSEFPPDYRGFVEFIIRRIDASDNVQTILVNFNQEASNRATAKDVQHVLRLLTRNRSLSMYFEIYD